LLGDEASELMGEEESRFGVYLLWHPKSNSEKIPIRDCPTHSNIGSVVISKQKLLSSTKNLLKEHTEGFSILNDRLRKGLYPSMFSSWELCYGIYMKV
jgi:hypothetical protein